MNLALQPLIASLTPTEKLKLVGELWDEIAASGEGSSLTPAQQSELLAERDAIRANPLDGATWPEVRSRILGSP